MEIKLFDNLKNALKDNRDELAQEEDLYGDGSYYGNEESAFDEDGSSFEGEEGVFDNGEEMQGAPARSSNVTLKVVKPLAYADGPDIADKLMDGSTVVLNLEEMNKESAIRLIDFLLGVAHVLEADMKKVSANTIVIAPGGIEEATYESDEDNGGYGND
jgi:FtsZ-interacting cell division protein YlmF